LSGKAIITGVYSSLEGQKQREKPVGRVQGFYTSWDTGNCVT